MGSIGPMELCVILFVVLLLFGAGRIANVGKGFGQAIREFREGIREEPAPKKDS
jgi:sec-independent protein translocase protein TatA